MKKSAKLISIVTVLFIFFATLAPCCFAADIPQSVLSTKDSVVKLVVDRWVYVDSYGEPCPDYGYVSIIESSKGGYFYAIDGPESAKEGELAYVGSGFVIEKGEEGGGKFTRIATAAHLLSDEEIKLYKYKGGSNYTSLGNYCTIRPTRISCVLGDDVLVSISLDKDDDEATYISNDCDFAIVKFNRNINREMATIYCGKELEAGKTVYALGFPQDTETYGKQSYTAENVVVTSGNINKYGRQTLVQSGKEVNCYTVDARISGGNSGGPLVDEHGNVIGINVQGTSDKSGNSSVDIAELITVMDDLGINYKPSNSGLPAWVWIVIVVAVIVVVAVLAVVLLIILIGKKKKKAALPGNPAAPTPYSNPAVPQPPVGAPGAPVPPAYGTTPAQPVAPVQPVTPIQPTTPVQPVAPVTTPAYEPAPVVEPTPAPAYEPAPVVEPAPAPTFDNTAAFTATINGGTLTRLTTNERIAINSASFKVGSGAGNEYCVNNNSMNQVHAEFIVRDGVTYLLDKNSTYGTFVNGVKIFPNFEKMLNNGDTITFANEQFIYNK